MAMTYSRSTLLSMRYWWRNLRNIQPMLPNDWNVCKAIGILKTIRGKRGGVRCNQLSTLRSNQISVINPSRRQGNVTDLKYGKRQTFVNYDNLLNIRPCPTPTRHKLDCATDMHKRPHFVPSILLSNTMSLMSKIDEIAHTVDITNPDIAAFTETWLNDHVPDELINIKGNQLFRRDRVNRPHGGVCLYVKTSIQCTAVSDLYNADHEVLWVSLKPNCLPRGFSNVVVGVVYHPPDAHNMSIKDYLGSSLETMESKYPNSAIIMTGDFNKSLLPMIQSTTRTYQLKPMIDFPTRGVNTLDKIFTNISEYYSTPSSLSPFGLSDHVTVFVTAGTRDRSSKPKCKFIKTRDKRPSKKSMCWSISTPSALVCYVL